MFAILFPLSVSQFYKLSSTLLRWRRGMLSVVILSFHLSFVKSKIVNETVHDEVKVETGRLRCCFPENKTFSRGSYSITARFLFFFIFLDLQLGPACTLLWHLKMALIIWQRFWRHFLKYIPNAWHWISFQRFVFLFFFLNLVFDPVNLLIVIIFLFLPQNR